MYPRIRKPPAYTGFLRNNFRTTVSKKVRSRFSETSVSDYSAQ